MSTGPLLRVDAVQLPVGDLEAALRFYRDRLGHELAWRTDTAAAVKLADSATELVLQTERPDPEVDLLVTSVEKCAAAWREAGGTVDVEPFDIPIGLCAVLRDPFGNRLVIVDTARGLFTTDADGRVTGVRATGEPA